MHVRPAAELCLDLDRAAIARQQDPAAAGLSQMPAERARGAHRGIEASGLAGREASRTTRGAVSAPATRRRSISSPLRATAGQWIRDAGLPSR